jgi:hypothetical protein
MEEQDRAKSVIVASAPRPPATIVTIAVTILNRLAHLRVRSDASSYVQTISVLLNMRNRTPTSANHRAAVTAAATGAFDPTAAAGANELR